MGLLQGPKLMAPTTKSPIQRNHWVPLGCRGHLGSVKTIEQSRGLEFPALLTISTEGKIAMELSEAHITGDLFFALR